jgi:hypothetical protein
MPACHPPSRCLGLPAPSGLNGGEHDSPSVYLSSALLDAPPLHLSKATPPCQASLGRVAITRGARKLSSAHRAPCLQGRLCRRVRAWTWLRGGLWSTFPSCQRQQSRTAPAPLRQLSLSPKCHCAGQDQALAGQKESVYGKLRVDSGPGELGTGLQSTCLHTKPAKHAQPRPA